MCSWQFFLFHGHGVFQLGEGHLGFGRRLAQERGDFMDNAHLLCNDLVGDLNGLALGFLQGKTGLFRLGDVLHQADHQIVAFIGNKDLLHILVVLFQVSFAGLGVLPGGEGGDEFEVVHQVGDLATGEHRIFGQA